MPFNFFKNIIYLFYPGFFFIFVPDEKFLMYPPSTLAASSICAAFSGLATAEQKSIWTRTRLVSFLQKLTNIEPVRKENSCRYKNRFNELKRTQSSGCQTKANTVLPGANKGKIFHYIQNAFWKIRGLSTSFLPLRFIFHFSTF